MEENWNETTNETNTSTEEGLNARLVRTRESSVKAFGDIQHRLESVDTINGVEWINDSKSTDTGSTLYSLDYMDKPVVWIVGSSDLEQDYTLFTDAVADKVSAICAYGAPHPGIEMLIEMAGVESTWTDTVDDAVTWCAANAANGSTVLFSPACSSFEFFEDFKQRGDAFKAAVKNLKSL